MNQDFDWLGHGPVTFTAAMASAENADVCVLLVPALIIIFLAPMSIWAYHVFECPLQPPDSRARRRKFSFSSLWLTRTTAGERLVWLLLKHSL